MAKLKDQAAVGAESALMPPGLERWPRVLIVEDEEDLRVLIAHQMRKWWSGAEIRAAGDSERALKILDDYAPDLAVVDVNLPGENGLSLCREIVSRPGLSRTKVLVLSGSRAFAVHARALGEGAVEFLPKPYESEALRAAAQRLLGNPRP